MEAERANLIAAIDQATAPGVPSEIAVQLAQGLFGFIAVRSHRGDLVRVNEIALGVARQLGDRAAQAQAAHDLGLGYWRRDQFEQALACLRESLAIFRELGDRRGQAANHHNLGFVYERQGRPEDALVCLCESLAIFRELGDLHGHAECLRDLGLITRALGRAEEARAHWRQALVLYEQLQATDTDQVRALLAEPLPHSQR